MPRFPVAFGKRRSAAHENVADAPTFRVLERTEVMAGAGGGSGGSGGSGARSLDAGSTMGRPLTSTPRTQAQPDMVSAEDNMFAGLKINRYVPLRWILFLPW
jgi:hypothetical protein